MRKVIDTNILLRYFTRQPKSLFKKAEKAINEEKQFYVPMLVLYELDFTLKGKVYQYSKTQSLKVLSYIEGDKKFKTSKFFSKALEVYNNSSLSLPDSYLIAICEQSKLYSFDKVLVKECKRRKIKTGGK